MACSSCPSSIACLTDLSGRWGPLKPCGLSLGKQLLQSAKHGNQLVMSMSADMWVAPVCLCNANRPLWQSLSPLQLHGVPSVAVAQHPLLQEAPTAAAGQVAAAAMETRCMCQLCGRTRPLPAFQRPYGSASDLLTALWMHTAGGCTNLAAAYTPMRCGNWSAG